MNRDDVLELMRLLQRALDYREEDMRPLEEVEKIKMRDRNLHMIVGDYGITKLSKVGFNSQHHYYPGGRVQDAD